MQKKYIVQMAALNGHHFTTVIDTVKHILQVPSKALFGTSVKI